MIDSLRLAGDRDGKSLAVNVINLQNMPVQNQEKYILFAREIARDWVGAEAVTLRSAGFSEAEVSAYRSSAMQAFDHSVSEEASRLPARFAN